MPTYEYACRECGEHVEVVQSFKDDALTDCPACDRADTLRKVFSAAGIIFKGSGWHVKDYSSAKSSGASPAGDSSSSSSTDDASSSSSSSDSTKSSPGSKGSTTSDSSSASEAKSA